MKYFAIRDESGEVISFGTTTASTPYEIAESEYLTIRHEVDTFNDYVNAVYSGEMSIDDVPEEHREAVAATVEGMQNQPEEPETMSDIDEALAILSGEVTE